jgi:tetratricopeptide (TPR) repeat protein
VSDLLAVLLAGLVSSNTPVAVSNAVPEKTAIGVPTVDPNDPIEKEFRKVEADDDAAIEEIEGWAAAAATNVMAGNSNPQLTLQMRARDRLAEVKHNYEDFLQRHPDYVRALLAYGSFLHQSGDGDGALAQWEKASKLAPNNPAVWNNLADYWVDTNVRKAFEYYSKAIELDPNQSVYYHNLAVCVYMYRTDAEDYWKISEAETFDKALALYQKAMKLDPANFVLASDYAECFYGIKPLRLEDGLAAWNHCLQIAQSDKDRQGVYIHLARLNLALKRFDESQKALDAVTNKEYSVLKNKLASNLKAAINQAFTNAPAQPAR